MVLLVGSNNDRTVVSAWGECDGHLDDVAVHVVPHRVLAQVLPERLNKVLQHCTHRVMAEGQTAPALGPDEEATLWVNHERKLLSAGMLS